MQKLVHLILYFCGTLLLKEFSRKSIYLFTTHRFITRISARPQEPKADNMNKYTDTNKYKFIKYTIINNKLLEELL